MTKRCGAKNRAGRPCRSYPMKGKRRCRLHGGLSTGAPKGSKNALKNGIYATGLTSQERGFWHAVPVGGLHEEIKLARVLVRRALIAKRPEMVSQFLRRVERLEAARAALLQQNLPPDDANKLASEVMGAVRRLDASIQAPPPGDRPAD